MSRKNSIDSTAMVRGMYVERHKHENTRCRKKTRIDPPLEAPLSPITIALPSFPSLQWGGGSNIPILHHYTLKKSFLTHFFRVTPSAGIIHWKSCCPTHPSFVRRRLLPFVVLWLPRVRWYYLLLLMLLVERVFLPRFSCEKCFFACFHHSLTNVHSLSN